MSTSRTAALTIGNRTSAGPKPTNTITPPDFVAWNIYRNIFLLSVTRTTKIFIKYSKTLTPEQNWKIFHVWRRQTKSMVVNVRLSFRTALHYKVQLLSCQKCQISGAKLVICGTKYVFMCKCWWIQTHFNNLVLS